MLAKFLPSSFCKWAQYTKSDDSLSFLCICNVSELSFQLLQNLKMAYINAPKSVQAAPFCGGSVPEPPTHSWNHRYRRTSPWSVRLPPGSEGSSIPLASRGAYELSKGWGQTELYSSKYVTSSFKEKPEVTSLMPYKALGGPGKQGVRGGPPDLICG